MQPQHVVLTYSVIVKVLCWIREKVNQGEGDPSGQGEGDPSAACMCAAYACIMHMQKVNCCLTINSVVLTKIGYLSCMHATEVAN